MLYLVDHPLYVLLIICAMLIINNWWWAVLLYYNTKRENLRYPVLWAFLALCTGGLITITVYKSIHKQSQLTWSPLLLGYIAREERKYGNKRRGYALMALSLLWIVDGIIYQFFLKGNHTFIVINFLISGLISIIILFVHIRSSFKNIGNMNLLNKAIPELQTTPQEPIDDSLTKHKKTVIFLVCFILSLPILLILYTSLFGN